MQATGIRLKRDCYIDWCNRFNVPICVKKPWKNDLPVIIDDNVNYEREIKNAGKAVYINYGEKQ